MTPYEKVCLNLIGEVPDNRRGKRPSGSKNRKRTAKDLAHSIGLKHCTILSWPLIPGTNIRIIPPGSAGIIEKLSGGAVTADEIREFAKRHHAGDAA